MKRIEKVVAKNINKILNEYDLTHQELADIAGVSVSTVGKWTLEKASPRMGAIEKISNHFGLPKSYILEEDYDLPPRTQDYTYYPTLISAGIPQDVEPITKKQKISISDHVMGKHAGRSDIAFLRVDGDSMDNIIPDGSLIAYEPVSDTYTLKNGDIVVYSNDYEYSVKHYYKHNDTLVFKPNSTNPIHKDTKIKIEEKIHIQSKQTLYIVSLD